MSQRADGKRYAVDGQHRTLAGVKAGYGFTKAKCHVYRNLTLAEEARLFLVLNNNRAVGPYDKFIVGLTAEDPDALAVNATLKKHGLQPSRSGGDGYLKCVDRAMKLHDNGLLDETLEIVTAAWGTRAGAVENQVLEGVSRVLDRYNGELDRAALVKKLSTHKGGPTALLGQARGLVALKSGMRVAGGVAEVIRDSYNKGRRAGALPPL